MLADVLSRDDNGRVRLLAVDRELQIMQRCAQLMGFDRPVKVQAALLR